MLPPTASPGLLNSAQGCIAQLYYLLSRDNRTAADGLDKYCYLLVT